MKKLDALLKIKEMTQLKEEGMISNTEAILHIVSEINSASDMLRDPVGQASVKVFRQIDNTLSDKYYEFANALTTALESLPD